MFLFNEIFNKFEDITHNCKLMQNIQQGDGTCSSKLEYMTISKELEKYRHWKQYWVKTQCTQGTLCPPTAVVEWSGRE